MVTRKIEIRTHFDLRTFASDAPARVCWSSKRCSRRHLSQKGGGDRGLQLQVMVMIVVEVDTRMDTYLLLMGELSRAKRVTERGRVRTVPGRRTDRY